MVGQALRTPAVAKTTPPGGSKVRRAGRFTPYLFLAPYLLLFAAFVGAPAVFGLWISLHDWDYLLPGKPFVGLANYTNLFDSASLVFESFWSSMQATGIFTLFSVPLLVVVPFGIALVLNRKFPGRTFFRAVYFAPYVLGVAVVCVLWRILLDPNNGPVNYLLGSPIPWVTNLPWVWISLVGITLWWTLGFNAVIYLAGLQDIPKELYEAARADGAGRWAQLRHVTLPGIRPVLLFVVTSTLLASANMFGQSFLLTNGAPGFETRTAIMYIANEGLKDYRMGSSAAMSYVFTFVLILISLLNFRLFRTKERS
ncbi:carbohydrate ABC transporter permease [Streptosporangium sp. KLBMP 9127]|nr:sugar ABC transporter permease [Streptosporangium sp. KLBMP 9127]